MEKYVDPLRSLVSVGKRLSTSIHQRTTQLPRVAFVLAEGIFYGDNSFL
jgi:hypothetical protein